MKSFIRLIGILCLAAFAAGLSYSCEKTKEDPDEDLFQIPETVFSLTADQLKNVSGTNSISFRLFSNAYSNPSYPNSWKQLTYDVNNLFLSPFSIQLAEAIMINQVSDHQAFIRMAGMKEGTDFNDYFGKLTGDLENTSKDRGSVLLSNALIRHPETEPFSDNYKSVLENSFHAPVYVFSEEYSEETAPWNVWTREHTDGMVEKVPSEVLYQYVKASRVSSAACFKSTWGQRMDGKNLLYDGEGFSAISLFLGEGSYMLTILVPDQGSGVNDVISHLTSDVWESIRNGLKWKKTLVAIPDINASLVYEHISFLIDSDFKNSYTNQVQSESIAQGKEPNYILFLSQSSALSIKRTSFYSSGTSDETNTFVVDKPFVYIISEAGSGLVLFIGTYSGS